MITKLEIMANRAALGAAFLVAVAGLSIPGSAHAASFGVKPAAEPEPVEAFFAQPKSQQHWAVKLPHHPTLAVDQKGPTSDGLGYYLRGRVKGTDMREMVNFCNQRMHERGWTADRYETAPGKVMRLSYRQGENQVVVNLSASRDGTLVAMAAGPYAVISQLVLK